MKHVLLSSALFITFPGRMMRLAKVFAHLRFHLHVGGREVHGMQDRCATANPSSLVLGAKHGRE